MNGMQDALIPESGDLADVPFCLPDDVPVSSLFLDESGTMNPNGGLFVVGFLKCRDTASIDREIRQLRQQFKFFDEIKFGRITQATERFYIELVEYLATCDVRIGGSVYELSPVDSAKRRSWETQAVMARRLVVANVNQGELVNVFLDLVQTPKGRVLADEVRERANEQLGTRRVLGCYDLNSESTNLLQVADVIAGAIAYDRRKWVGEVPDAPASESTPKGRVAGRLRRAFGLDSFGDVRRGRVNILTMNRV